MKATFKQFLEAAYYQDRDQYDCPDCYGKGYQVITIQYGEEDFDHDKDPCDTCHSTGKLSKPEYLRLTKSA